MLKPRSAGLASSSPVGTELYGLALYFGTWSRDWSVPAAMARRTGFGSARFKIRPGAFDVRACRDVRLTFDHDRAQRLCGTASGALVIRADERRVSFYLRGTCRSGKDAVRRARRLGRREVSLGMTFRGYEWHRGRGGDPNTVIVTAAELFEVSLVRSGAFPHTRVEFL